MPEYPPYSRAGLQRAAEYYLARYASSSANLRRVLQRKLHRRGCEAADAATQAGWVEEILAEMQRLGCLNDAQYAEMQVHSLRRRGVSRRGLNQRLASKGVSADQVSDALAGAEAEDGDGETAELTAARAYLRRTRRGPFRTAVAEDAEKQRQQDLQALARQGYSYVIARAALEISGGKD